MKRKFIYTVTPADSLVPVVAYTCLLTACQEWELKRIYSSVAREIRQSERHSYENSQVTISRLELVRAKYRKK